MGDASAQGFGQSAARLPLEGKPAPSVGGSSTAHAGLRIARTAGYGEAAGHGNRSAEAQPALVTASSSIDASELARGAGGAHGVMSTPGELARSSADSAAAESPPETFAALDAQAAPGAPAWIHAEAHRAEAGFQDPALGWVGVRADMSGGGIHAALVPGSAEAAQALGGHIAGLNSYLAEQRTHVETLTLAAPEGSLTGEGTHQGMHHRAHHGDAQDPRPGSSSPTQTSSQPASPPREAVALPEGSLQTGGLDGIADGAGTGGGHISLIA